MVAVYANYKLKTTRKVEYNYNTLASIVKLTKTNNLQALIW
jgi:hypothetical protein